MDSFVSLWFDQNNILCHLCSISSLWPVTWSSPRDPSEKAQGKVVCGRWLECPRCIGPALDSSVHIWT